MHQDLNLQDTVDPQPIVADKVSATSYRLRETGRNGGTAVETYNLKKGTSYS